MRDASRFSGGHVRKTSSGIERRTSAASRSRVTSRCKYERNEPSSRGLSSHIVRSSSAMPPRRMRAASTSVLSVSRCRFISALASSDMGSRHDIMNSNARSHASAVSSSGALARSNPNAVVRLYCISTSELDRTTRVAASISLRCSSSIMPSIVFKSGRGSSSPSSAAGSHG